MDAIDLAQQVLDRLNGVQAAFTLPEMTDADRLVWLDSLRIPEALAAIDRGLNLTPEARPHMGDYIRDQEARRAGWLSTLADLKAAYEAGDLDTADYERITSPQPDYTPEHLQSLRAQVARFLPQHTGTAANGLPVYRWHDQDGTTVWLTYEDEQWIKHANYPYSIFD